MASPLKEFGQIAQRLARNPLGIIALFIVLIYGFAALLLGMSGETLDAGQRWPIVWFIVVFPFVVLLAFYRLVTNHHQKLYAPSDYRDEKLFFYPLTAAEQQARVEYEVQEVAPAPVSDAALTTSGGLRAPETASRESIVLAQELALRQLELELGVPVNRQVGVSALPGVTFDGATSLDGGVIFVEVKYTRQPVFSPRLLRAGRGVKSFVDS